MISHQPQHLTCPQNATIGQSTISIDVVSRGDKMCRAGRVYLRHGTVSPVPARLVLFIGQTGPGRHDTTVWAVSGPAPWHDGPARPSMVRIVLSPAQSDLGTARPLGLCIYIYIIKIY